MWNMNTPPHPPNCDRVKVFEYIKDEIKSAYQQQLRERNKHFMCK